MKKDLKKRILEAIAFILLVILVAISTYTAKTVHEINKKPAVVWLIPNDASCGDIWTAEELRNMSEKYELIEFDENAGNQVLKLDENGEAGSQQK